MRRNETKKIPGYKALWRDVYRISPGLAWVGLFAFVGGVAFTIFGCCIAVVAAYETRGCLFAVAVAAVLGSLTIGILFGMYKDISAPIPWIEDENEIEE